VLYIDDFRQAGDGLMTDSRMDAQVHAMLVAAGYQEAEIFQLDTFGPDDSQTLPTPVRLSDLARYKLVVWSNWGAGYQGASALVSANACPTGRVLQAYVRAGGAAWIYGQQVFGAFQAFRGSPTCRATLGYDEYTALNFTGYEFVVEFLHIVSGGGFRDVKSNSKTNGMIRGKPTAEARAELFPQVEVDSTVYAVATRGGLTFVDALFTPEYSAGLDTLYTMDAAKTNSKFRGKPLAFRYLDPDPGSGQGPVAVFGFPFHWLKQGSAADRTGVQGMARSMVDWFRQHGG
jgi:hypothetical protein